MLPLSGLLLLVALVTLSCGHRAYLLLLLCSVADTHTVRFSFCGVGVFFVRVRFSSPSLRLGPGVICCGLVPCRMRLVRRRQCGGNVGGCFFGFCMRRVGGVSCISLPPCSIPSPPWLLAAFLLVHAPAVLPLAVALGGLVIHTWQCCLCWRSGALGGVVWLPPCFCARAFSSCFFLHSSTVIPFFFFAASVIACMYSVALHTLIC